MNNEVMAPCAHVFYPPVHCRSAWATVQYMKRQKIEGKVYVVGEQGLVTELEKEGYEPYGLEHNDIKGLPTPLTVDPSTKAVIVGLDRCVLFSDSKSLCELDHH